MTTATLSAHIGPPSKGPGAFTLLELPNVLREELDMRVIDLNTANFTNWEPAYLEKFRAAAADADCVLTNLKLNQKGIDLGSADPEEQKRALTVYKQSIDHAALMGIRWVRPLPLKENPHPDTLIAGHRELADYAVEKGITVLIENFGWMQGDPNSVVDFIAAVDRGLPASPDTGNWNSNEIRYAGLGKTFPLAVTCDFKARAMGPNGEHELYDLERCFRIGWDSGFRGPWCFEHANPDREKLFKELAMLRDMLRGWMGKE